MPNLRVKLYDERGRFAWLADGLFDLVINLRLKDVELMIRKLQWR